MVFYKIMGKQYSSELRNMGAWSPKNAEKGLGIISSKKLTFFPYFRNSTNWKVCQEQGLTPSRQQHLLLPKNMIE